MRGIWFWVIFAVTLCLFSTRKAAAQPGFTDDGRIVVGAERLTGLFFEKIRITQTTTVDNPMGGSTTSEETADFDTSTFGLFGTSAGILDDAQITGGGPSISPRLALDVFVASGLSVGGAFTYVHSAGTYQFGDEGSPGEEEDQPTFDGIVLAPRVGYGIPLSPKFAIWPRAGITYSVNWGSEENVGFDEMGEEVSVEQTTTLTMFDLTLEGMVAVTPAPNVAIVFGPFLDLALFGSVVEESTPDQSPPGVVQDIAFRYTSFGLAGGIALVF